MQVNRNSHGHERQVSARYRVDSRLCLQPKLSFYAMGPSLRIIYAFYARLKSIHSY